MRARLFRLGMGWALACGLGLALAAAVAAATGSVAPTAANVGAAPLRLDDRQHTVTAWPAVTMLADAGHSLTLAEVRARVRDFLPPAGPESSLGQRREAIWLRLPVQVASGDGRWVIDVDYPLLNQVDIWLLSDGQLMQHHRMGSTLPFDQRPMPSRVPALAVHLPADQVHEFYLRVLTDSSMVLPIRLSKPNAFMQREDRVQMVQGLIAGVALALLIYSLAHWLSLRNALFGLYALMLMGSTSFFLIYFGIAQQYLWAELTGTLAKAAPLSVLVAVAAGALFVARSLETALHQPRIHQGLMLLSLACTGVFAVSMLGGLDYRSTQMLTTLLGPVLPLLSIPPALGRARAGDRAALYLLAGWLCYALGAFTTAGLLRGLLPANVVTQNLFQLASLLEMLAWLRVLGLHIEGVRRGAERSELEKQALLSLAHTDALTGLPNRRGLSLALAGALPACRPDSALVVYLLDLDGFKPINDRLGHEAGDELLVLVGQRLKAQLRHSDVVARLGGDEFVIMTAGVGGEAEALALGRKLLDAFLQPFEVAGQACRVGLTIGFALAPHDGREAGDLLKRADAAMYAGKQAGRHTVRRGGASAGMAV